MRDSITALIGLMSDERRNKTHYYGDVKFFLSDFSPRGDQCRYLMLKVLEQAVRDYVALHNSEVPNERVLWEEAHDFIYDDQYRFWWGKLELSTEEFLDILDLDINWVREQTTKKFNNRKV